jgi:hypothetical protein
LITVHEPSGGFVVAESVRPTPAMVVIAVIAYSPLVR